MGSEVALQNESGAAIGLRLVHRVLPYLKTPQNAQKQQSQLGAGLRRGALPGMKVIWF